VDYLRFGSSPSVCAFCIIPAPSKHATRHSLGRTERGMLKPKEGFTRPELGLREQAGSAPWRQVFVNKAFDKVRNCISSDTLNRLGACTHSFVALPHPSICLPLTQPLPPYSGSRSAERSAQDTNNTPTPVTIRKRRSSLFHGPIIAPAEKREQAPALQTLERVRSPWLSCVSLFCGSISSLRFLRCLLFKSDS